MKKSGAAAVNGVESRENEEAAAPIENLGAQTDAIDSRTSLQQMMSALKHCGFFEFEMCLESAAVALIRSSQERHSRDEHSRKYGRARAIDGSPLREFEAELVEKPVRKA